MQSFDDSLSAFLVDCRESALNELKQDKRYQERSIKQEDLLAQIKTLLTPEGNMLFEEYRENATALLSLEYNRTLLCGLTTQNDLLKRFDSNSPEHQAFVTKFLNATTSQPN